MKGKSVPAPALLGWGEAAAATLLLWSCYLPWLSVLGAPVPSQRIREQLEGPHRLVSAFTSGSRISFDYSISLWLRVLPFVAAIALLAALRPHWPGAARSETRRSRNTSVTWGSGARPAVGLIGGAGALIAFFYLRFEAGHWPFVHLAYGAGLAACAGAALAGLSSLRLFSLRKK